MLDGDMNLKIRSGTVGYNNKILVSDGKFSLGKNDEVNSLETPAIKNHKTNSLETPAIKNHKTNSLETLAMKSMKQWSTQKEQLTWNKKRLSLLKMRKLP